MNRFTRKDVGCWLDGAFGMDVNRSRLADLLISHLPKKDLERMEETIEALQGSMSDDDWETDEALDALQTITEEGIVWEFDSGDLLLRETKE